jgi:hypothetical protein
MERFTIPLLAFGKEHFGNLNAIFLRVVSSLVALKRERHFLFIDALRILKTDQVRQGLFVPFEAVLVD